MPSKPLDRETLQKLGRCVPTQGTARPTNEGRNPSQEQISKALKEASDPKRLSGNKPG